MKDCENVIIQEEQYHYLSHNIIIIIDVCYQVILLFFFIACNERVMNHELDCFGNIISKDQKPFVNIVLIYGCILKLVLQQSFYDKQTCKQEF